MWTYLVAFFICVFIVKWYHSLFVGFENVDKMFPGPIRWPIVGNLPHFIGTSSALYANGIPMIASFKRSMRAWLFHRLFIVVVKPHEVETLLNNSVNLQKSDIYDYIIPWIGRGLLTSYGPKWKKNRKLLTPAFHFKILESFLEIFSENSQILCKKLEAEIGKSGFDVMDYVRLHAMDNICETSMGVKINSQYDPDSELIKATKLMCHISFVRVVNPWHRWNPFYNYTSLGRKQAKALKILHSFTRKVIKSRIQQRRDGIEENKDWENNDVIGIKKKQAFLDILLDAMDDSRMTLQELQDEVDTFMFEGHDTVTSALSFCIYNLAHHPQYQAKAYEEIREIFGDDDRRCTADDVSKMKYLEMVIKETLRIHPSVPVFGRYIEKDIPLSEECIIPKGCEGVITTEVVHTDPESWERPNEFYPDHFLPETAAKRHPYAFIPFSAGPRNCIGMRFAMLELKVTVSEILRNFLLLPNDPVVPLRKFVEATLQSETGVHVSIARRNKN